MRNYLFPLIASFVLMGCSSTADKTAATETVAINVAKTETSDMDKSTYICQSEAVLGSRMTKRVCRTAEQIREDREKTQRQLEKTQLRNSRNGGGL